MTGPFPRKAILYRAQISPDQKSQIQDVVEEMRNPDPHSTTTAVGEALLRYGDMIDKIISQET